MKMIWDEKVGSQRDLLLRAQDSLIGKTEYNKKTDYGLPNLDTKKPRVGYRYVEALRTAPESVKKIFSVEFGQKSDLTGAWKSEMAESIIGHNYDEVSHKAKSKSLFWNCNIAHNFE
jgi:hypothetical protein